MEMEFWVILGHFGEILKDLWSFWQASGNGKTTKNEKNIATSDALKGFWMPEHGKPWKNMQNLVFWTDFMAKNA